MKKRMIQIVALCLMVVMTTLCLSACCLNLPTDPIQAITKKGPDFKALYEDIDSDVKYGWSVGSDGSYLSADTNVYDLEDYSNSAIFYSIREMNETLGLPDSLYNDMLGTSWGMGKQQETYENVGIKVTWTYHPDKGLEVTYKLINN